MRVEDVLPLRCLVTSCSEVILFNYGVRLRETERGRIFAWNCARHLRLAALQMDLERPQFELREQMKS